MSKEYEITTLQDCMQIPMEKWDLFLRELGQMLTNARLVAERGLKVQLSLPVVWVDDDRGEIRANVAGQAERPGNREET